MTQKKIKVNPTKVWACVNPNGGIDYTAMSYTRSEAIKKYIHGWAPEYTWKQLYRYGHRCIKVKIEPLTP